jgi:hypothetical protein
VTLDCYTSLQALPPSARALLDGPGREDLFTSAPWLESFTEAGMAQNAEPALVVLSDAGGQTQAILPCQRFPMPDSGPGHPSIASLTSFYSCDFRPIIPPGLDLPEVAFALGREIARVLRREPVVRFDSLDETHPSTGPFLKGLASSGRASLRYDHFGRWHEDLGSGGIDAYLAARDGALREIIRRKGARLLRDGAVMVIENDTARGIADYESVYAASWKEPEPFPAFQPALMRRLAAAGWLRLAILRLGDRPIAAQLWAVVNRRATVLKLAHDSAFDRYSPGTILTAFAIRTLIEQDGITGLDFGRGDDPYKRAWTSKRTQHIGVLSVDIMRRPLLVARHLVGEFAKLF